jgi:hypothetical protein
MGHCHGESSEQQIVVGRSAITTAFPRRLTNSVGCVPAKRKLYSYVTARPKNRSWNNKADVIHFFNFVQ